MSGKYGNHGSLPSASLFMSYDSTTFNRRDVLDSGESSSFFAVDVERRMSCRAGDSSRKLLLKEGEVRVRFTTHYVMNPRGL